MNYEEELNLEEAEESIHTTTEAETRGRLVTDVEEAMNIKAKKGPIIIKGIAITALATIPSIQARILIGLVWFIIALVKRHNNNKEKAIYRAFLQRLDGVVLETLNAEDRAELIKALVALKDEFTLTEDEELTRSR